MSQWLAYHNSNPGAQVRLFCFPYAGGSASIYRDWVGRLAPNIEVWPVQLPGRETRLSDAPFRRIEPLVKEIGREILPLLDKPFAFFGHSLGGKIGFELALELRRTHGLTPCHLFVSASSAPHLPREEETIHDLPYEKLLQKLYSLGGTPDRIIKHDRLLKRVLPSIRADFEIYDTYQYSPEPPIDCPITALIGRDDKVVSEERVYAWEKHTGSSFHLRYVPGDHFFVTSSRPLLLQIVSEELYRTMNPAHITQHHSAQQAHFAD